MRTYDELVSAILAAVPKPEELAGLTPEQKKTLTGATNIVANEIYWSTPEGIALRAELRERKSN